MQSNCKECNTTAVPHGVQKCMLCPNMDPSKVPLTNVCQLLVRQFQVYKMTEPKAKGSIHTPVFSPSAFCRLALQASNAKTITSDCSGTVA